MHTRPHILVVDDEPQITRVLRTSLGAQGYEIRVANDGETALEIVKDFVPDLVITDLAMPRMNGIELCRQLRKISQVPIIVLSVRGEERSKVEALDSGADDYVTKPFGSGELLARIRAALRRSLLESVQSVRVMTTHLRARAHVALALTGIAGPGGGTDAKPVGTVFLSTAGPAGTTVKERFFHGDRHQIQTLAAYAGLQLLREACAAT